MPGCSRRTALAGLVWLDLSGQYIDFLRSPGNINQGLSIKTELIDIPLLFLNLDFRW